MRNHRRLRGRKAEHGGLRSQLGQQRPVQRVQRVLAADRLLHRQHAGSVVVVRMRAQQPAHVQLFAPHELDHGLGHGEASYLASDLSYEYVRLNAEYTT